MQNYGTTPPDFVSYGDWEKTAKARRMRALVRIGCFLGGIGLAYCALIGRDVYQRYQTQNAILAGLANLRNYEIDVRAAGPGGKLVPWRKEIHIGKDWQIDLWGGDLRFTKRGNTFYTDDATAGLTRTYAASDNAHSFIGRAMEAIRNLSAWHPAANGSWFTLTDSEPNGSRTWRFRSFDGDWSILENGAGVPLRITFSSGDFGKWSDEEVADVTAANLQFAPCGIYSASPKTAPTLRSVPVPGSAPIQILKAEMNARGDAFFAFAGETVKNARNIFRAKKDRFYTLSTHPVDLQSGRSTEVDFVADDNNKPEWPTTLHIYVLTQEDRRVDFLYTFPKATCTLLPLWSVPIGGDRPYLQALHDFSIDRAGYFDQVYYQNGQPHMPTGFVPSTVTTMPQDREEAVSQTLLAIVCDHDLVNFQDPMSREVLVSDWGSCGQRLEAINQSKDTSLVLNAERGLGAAPDPNSYAMRRYFPVGGNGLP